MRTHIQTSHPRLSTLSLAILGCLAGHAQADTTLSTVDVNARNEEKATDNTASIVVRQASSGTKVDTPLVETPQSISVVTSDEMRMRGVQNMNDAVAYTAGVLTEISGMDSRVDDFSIRGFNAGSWSINRYVDGLRTPSGGQWTTTQFDTYGLERVEVLKGPSGVLYGQIAPGGLVNMTSKRPTVDKQREVAIQVSSHDQLQGRFDLSGPLNADKTVLARLVGMSKDGDSVVDHTTLGRHYIAPSLTWLPSEKTEVTVLASYQKDFGGTTFQFLPTTGTRQGKQIDRNVFFGEPDWNVYDREQQTIGYSVQHKPANWVELRQSVRYFKVDSLFRGAVLAPQNCAILSAAAAPGTVTCTANAFDATPEGWAGRRAVEGRGTSEGWTVDNQALFRFSTGPLRHTALAGVDWLKTAYQHERDLVWLTGNQVTPINIYNPQYSGTAGWRAAMRPQIYQDAVLEQTGLYIQDQIALDKWRLTLGARHDRFKNDVATNTNPAAVTHAIAKDNSTTLRTGLLYLFDNGLAPYASYSESFEPATGTDWQGNTFDPTTGEQVEIGVKFQPRDGRSLITVALFEIKQENLTATDPDPTHNVCGSGTSPCSLQLGSSRTRGLEVEGKVDLTRSLSLIASWTHMKTEITKDASASGGTGNKGNELELRPKHMASLWLDHTQHTGPLAGLSVGAGTRYVGDSWGDISNDTRVPSYTLFDASVRYDLRQLGLPGLQLALNGNNLSDRLYYTAASATGTAYGSGRMVSANLRYQW